MVLSLLHSLSRVPHPANIKGYKMVDKLDLLKDSENCVDCRGFTHNVAKFTVINKVNELIEVVNGLILENNIHEKQIDKIQMRVENIEDEINNDNQKVGEPSKDWGKYREWIGYLCKFRDLDEEPWHYGILRSIAEDTEYPFWDDTDTEYRVCELVKFNDEKVKDVPYMGELNGKK